jgi:hypothetical protein
MPMTGAEFEDAVRDPLHDLVIAGIRGIDYVDLPDDPAELLKQEAEKAFSDAEERHEIDVSPFNENYEVIQAPAEHTGHTICQRLLDDIWAEHVDRPRVVADISMRRTIAPAGYARHQDYDETTVVTNHIVEAADSDTALQFCTGTGEIIPLKPGRVVIVPDVFDYETHNRTDDHVVRGRAMRLLSAWTMIAPDRALF